jgi:hypothetical protein
MPKTNRQCIDESQVSQDNLFSNSSFKRNTVASEKDDQMSETMIKNGDLPNPHLFEPFFCTRACYHPSSQLIYRRRLFLKLFEAYIISYFS